MKKLHKPVLLGLLPVVGFAMAAHAGPLDLPVGAGPLGPVTLPRNGVLPGVLNTVNGTLDSTLRVVRDTVGRPQHQGVFDRDPQGFKVLRQTVLALSPSEASMALARGLGFQIVHQEEIGSLGLRLIVLRAPDNMTATDALVLLRRSDPAGVYDYDHIYDPSGDGREVLAIASTPTAELAALRIGMIDGGVDRHHGDFSHATIVSKNFASEKNSVPTAHGTAVASLLIGQGEDGTLPSATLFAADVYGGEANGGAADSIARALGWIAGNGVPVVNVSLAGPPNIVLEAAVRAFLKRGHVLVAAAGNNGPAAPPEFPAAYPGVAAVTSVDSDRHVQIDANQGAYIAFAGPGVRRRIAALPGGHATATGTSYAAPSVAVRFAMLLSRPDPHAAQAAWTALEGEAVDLGAPGRDPVFGFGYLAPLVPPRTAARP